jgi:hypothetical protein
MTEEGPMSRTFRIVRMHSDDAGHTTFTEVTIPGPSVVRDGALAHELRFPGFGIEIAELLEWRPMLDLHRPPRRQLIIILQGAMEISTTNGERRKFTPGDCLLAEDMHGIGHRTEDVGELRLVTLNIGVPDNWRLPEGAPQT